jgi:hypothetical protein
MSQISIGLSRELELIPMVIQTTISLLVPPDIQMNLGSMHYSLANEKKSIQKGILISTYAISKLFTKGHYIREQSSRRWID